MHKIPGNLPKEEKVRGGAAKNIPDTLNTLGGDFRR